MALSTDDIERLMVAMTRHRVTVVQVGDVRLVKRIHELAAPPTATKRAEPVDDEDDLDEWSAGGGA